MDSSLLKTGVNSARFVQMQERHQLLTGHEFLVCDKHLRQ